jgi:phosphoglycerate dehydrogenase-like enzyme
VLIDLRDEYRVWLDNLPASIQWSRLAARLQTITELDCNWMEPPMKALFLGTLAASQAMPIIEFITADIRTEVLDSNEPAQADAALADADVLLTGAWRSGFPAVPKLRLLQVPLAGTDGIDVSSLPRGVTLCNAYGHEPALGEFAIMMMLAWRHRLFEIATSFREGSWSWSPIVGGAVRGEIGGQTVGIVGLGHIGREVAWRSAALGCRVLAVNRTMREKPAPVEHVFSWTELDRMLGECDIVVLSCALTPETTGLIDARRLAAMKPGAFLINLARGPIAGEQALYRALRDGVIGGAALDTWWRYPSADDPAPRPSSYPFHELPNVIMTPHCSPRTDGTIERRSRNVARNIDRFVRGEPLENVVTKT